MIYKRNNDQRTEIKGTPMYLCDVCGKQFQTKGIAEHHKCSGGSK